MLGMKNHFDISGSIEIREVDIAGVACISMKQSDTLSTEYRHVEQLHEEVWCQKINYY